MFKTLRSNSHNTADRPERWYRTLGNSVLFKVAAIMFIALYLGGTYALAQGTVRLYVSSPGTGTKSRDTTAFRERL